MIRILVFLFLLLYSTHCYATTITDLSEIHALAKTAFFEAAFESRMNVRVQMYSVLNRARINRLSVKETTTCTRKRCWYSFNLKVSKAEQVRRIKLNRKLYKRIYKQAYDIYSDYKAGVPLEMPITKFHDSYITKRLARSRYRPVWFRRFCKDKRTIQGHVYCIAIPRKY